MAIRSILLGLSFVLWAMTARAETLNFSSFGKPVKTLTLQEMQVLSPAISLKIFEGHEGRERTYKVIPLTALFQAVYGDSWKKADEILFTCVDGYQPSVPINKIKSKKSFVAFAVEGGEPFQVNHPEKKGEIINLGPLYLVWDNLNDNELREEGMADFPYQLESVDLILFSDRFPNLAPPKKSSPIVEKGFLSFRKQCLKCHSINGEGGGKSIELNYPVSVTEYFREDLLKKFISDPTSVRYNSAMPAINPALKNRDTEIRNILAYLRAMSKNKKKPAQ